ncbi:MAG: gas vesicle protein GvpN [Verrucomicrobia bacterium]|nr:gas vesicle protein GvpN [Verrucomicrobiota bacterium]MCF7707518.1 gas vesicle protein GvpN [Verrucomicrobiota bacterium]
MGSGNGNGLAGVSSIVRVKTEGDNVELKPSDAFVLTKQVNEIIERALIYLKSGFPVHFSGPAGTGKTTLAFHVAAKLGNLVTLIHGNEEFGTSDLIGQNAGHRRSRLVDNFIHSVVKTQEETRSFWVDNRLTTACERGDTLIYDEFSRSRPEANNVLLSVLSEGILNLPKLRTIGDGYMRVNPSFRAIFTSNPEEYAGVHKTQDALKDRLITINLGHYDRETEIKITQARSGIDMDYAEVIVDIIKGMRQIGVNNHQPTIRAGIMIAKVLKKLDKAPCWEDRDFRYICKDVLGQDTAKVTRDGEVIAGKLIEDIAVKTWKCHLKKVLSDKRSENEQF